MANRNSRARFVSDDCSDFFVVNVVVDSHRDVSNNARKVRKIFHLVCLSFQRFLCFGSFAFLNSRHIHTISTCVWDSRKNPFDTRLRSADDFACRQSLRVFVCVTVFSPWVGLLHVSGPTRGVSVPCEVDGRPKRRDPTESSATA